MILPIWEVTLGQAIMDAEALGVSYQNAMANGTGVRAGLLIKRFKFMIVICIHICLYYISYRYVPTF